MTDETKTKGISEERRKKIAESMRAYHLGKKHSEETKRKIGESVRRYHQSGERG
jgi:hypothetical protein